MRKTTKIVATPNKVGRPQKYKTEEDRKEAKRIHDRINQRECRRRKRIKELEKEIERIVISNKESLKCNKNIHQVKSKKGNIEYRESLASFFGKFEYDTLFTGTLNPTKKDYNKVKKVEKDVNYQTQRHERIFDTNPSQRLGINAFIKSSDRYINDLLKNGLFKRCFGVFELGKNNNIHIHILFKKGDNVKNFRGLLKKKWMLGNSHTKAIKQKEANRMISYCVKDLKPFSSNKKDLINVDYWLFEGNFDKQ